MAQAQVIFNPNPNSSQEFFETGIEKFEQEIELLQKRELDKTPEQILKLNLEDNSALSNQHSTRWCLDKNNNVVFTSDDVVEEDNSQIPLCR